MCFLVLIQVSSVESEFCIEEKFGIKLTLAKLSCDSSKPKRADILFYKKSSSSQFWIWFLGKKRNFLSNQKAGKLMNVTRNKLSLNINRYSNKFSLALLISELKLASSAGYIYMWFLRLKIILIYQIAVFDWSPWKHEY